MIEIKDKAECCACEGCVNICPKQAIEMISDEKGFLFPKIDDSKCVECGLCEKVCPLKNYESSTNKNYSIYAVINKKHDELLKSASGGAFSALAHWTIDNGGVVFGCAWDDEMNPHHVCIEKIDDLKTLQGSKYVQSRIGSIYKTVKEFLMKDQLVLFSGTPCQCDGLRMFLEKDYDQLICVELICHGVPSAQLFGEYLKLLEKNINGKIIDVQFRDKKRGWGALLHIVYKGKDNRVKHKYLSTEESFYYYYYWGANLYRDSCYNCKYSELPRKSDITIGDFWGVQRAHPDIDNTKGVSVVITSTQKGEKVISTISDYVDIRRSNIQAAIAENGQLVKRSQKGDSTEYVWELYLAGGVEAIKKDYSQKNKVRILKGMIKRKTPIGIKKMIKKLLGY